MTTLVGPVCLLLGLFNPCQLFVLGRSNLFAAPVWTSVRASHLHLMAPILRDRTLPSLVGDPLGCLAPGQGMCSFRILGPASSGQAGMVERSCTKWLELCLMLPAVVGVTMDGCQTAAWTACSDMWVVISAQQGNCQPGMCHGIKPCHR